MAKLQYRSISKRTVEALSVERTRCSGIANSRASGCGHYPIGQQVLRGAKPGSTARTHRQIVGKHLLPELGKLPAARRARACYGVALQAAPYARHGEHGNCRLVS